MSLVIFYQKNAVQFLREARLQFLEDTDDFLALDRFEHVADRAERHCRFGIIIRRYDMNGDMARVRIAFQTVENRKAGIVRQADIKQHGAWQILFGHRQPLFGCVGQQTLEILFMR